MNSTPSPIGSWLQRQNHWIGALGIVFGALLSAYFYFASKQGGEVSLKFKTVKIAQAGVPVLRISDDKGELITADVYGLEAVIWNSGDFSLGITSDRTRKPLTFSFTEPVRVIGAVVQDTRNVDSANIRATIDRDQKTVTIEWAQFDPGDAVKLFIIYSGKAQSAFEYAARFVGTNLSVLSEYKETVPNSIGLEKYYGEMIYTWNNQRLVFIFMIFMALATIVLVGILFFRRDLIERSRWLLPVMALSSGFMSLFSFLAPWIPGRSPF